MKKEIIGILRDKQFSPNHIENDAQIMQVTANELEKYGYSTKMIYEDHFINQEYDSNVYISMGRNDVTLKKLQELEEKGAIVINSAMGVLNSFRETMTPVLTKNKISIPRSIVFDTDSFDPALYDSFGAKKVWLKRENHSLHREDVTPIYSKAECETTVREFKNRGIKQALLQENKYGAEVKFYGVRNTDFFFWYYVNGIPHYKFSEDVLKDTAQKTADLLNIDIYGGDVIISSDGDIALIDFNDWPSFAPAREAAGKKIAEFIHNSIVGTA